jgi:glutamine---fructose-6-phosphate transaminase (isomerizing)
MNETSSETGYLGDLLAQPRAMRDTLNGLAEHSLPSSITERLAAGDFRRVVLTGMGSSFHVFHPLWNALVRRGIDALMVETSELLYSLPALLREDSLVVSVSQSGYSAEIISLLNRRAQGFTLLGVTNTESSPLAQMANACIITRAGEEQTVSCKTYLVSLAALAWLEPALFGEPTAPVMQVLEAAMPHLETYIARLPDFVTALQSRLD